MFKTDVEILTIFNAAKNFNKFIKTFIIVIKKSSPSAKDYHLSLSILTHFKLFRKHSKIFNEHSKIEAFEYITLKEIIIYDTIEIQRQFVQMIQAYLSL